MTDAHVLFCNSVNLQSECHFPVFKQLILDCYIELAAAVCNPSHGLSNLWIRQKVNVLRRTIRGV